MAKRGFMLKNLKKLFKEISSKGKGLYVTFAIASLPLSTLRGTVYTNQTEPSLIIPEDKLDVAFDIKNTSNNSSVNVPKIQIPIEFTYMSQGFHIFHPGIDLASEYGTSIKPIMAGTVEEAGFSPFGYGNVIIIDHGNGLESLYAHLYKIEVKKGNEVSLSTEIGLVGVTGHSTGPHLHLEIHKNGIPINPLTILPPLKEASLLSLR